MVMCEGLCIIDNEKTKERVYVRYSRTMLLTLKRQKRSPINMNDVYAADLFFLTGVNSLSFCTSKGIRLFYNRLANYDNNNQNGNCMCLVIVLCVAYNVKLSMLYAAVYKTYVSNTRICTYKSSIFSVGCDVNDSDLQPCIVLTNAKSLNV